MSSNTSHTPWYTNTYKLEQQLTPVVANMEMAGVKIDIKELRKVKSELLDIQAQLQADIHKVLGKNININSNEQLSQALFDDLQLQSQVEIKNKKGFYPVDKTHLKKLVDEHEVIAMLLDYRKTKSLLKSVSQLSLIHPKTKRLHASFNQIGTATGRFISSKPNMQNVNSNQVDKEETNRLKILESKFRQLIVPAKGNVFVGADYSQIELRITAEFSQDPFLLKAYREGLDIHTLTASEVFDVAFKDVLPEQRKVAKTINFGLIYGMSPIGLAQSLTQITQKHHTKEQVADYQAYLELKKLHYTNADISKHLSYSKSDLGYLISRFTFTNPLEYKLQEQEGSHHFGGKFYITSNAQNILTSEEIKEIYDFIQDLVKQHDGIDYLQVFYCAEHDCKLFFIDQLNQQMLQSGEYSEEHHYCTLMLESDY